MPAEHMWWKGMGFTTEQADRGPCAAEQTPASRAEPEPSAGRGAVEEAAIHFLAEMLHFTFGCVLKAKKILIFQQYALNRF